MTTLTHTAALPIRPGNGVSLFESARTAYRALRSAIAPKTQPQATFGNADRPRRRPQVVYMRFYA